MEKNKTATYLKYAIGEIALVVIGILIALTINNWNQDRIEKNRAYSYLEQIHGDLAHDLEYLDLNIRRFSSTIQLLDDARNNNFANDTALVDLGSAITANSDPREFAKAYKSLVNSGAVELIEDRELIAKIDEYYLTTCVYYNNLTGYQRDFNIQNIEGVLVHRLVMGEDGRYTPESIRGEIESGSLVSIINWQNMAFKQLKSDAEFCRKEAKEIQELIMASE